LIENSIDGGMKIFNRTDDDHTGIEVVNPAYLDWVEIHNSSWGAIMGSSTAERYTSTADICL